MGFHDGSDGKESACNEEDLGQEDPWRREWLLIPVGIPCGSAVQNLPANAGDTGDTGSIPGSGRSPGVRAWQPTPVFLPGESHGQRSLVGYSPWGHRESYTTEWLNLLYSVVIRSPSFEGELFSLSSGLNQLLLHLSSLSVLFCKMTMITAAINWSCWVVLEDVSAWPIHVNC